MAVAVGLENHPCFGTYLEVVMKRNSKETNKKLVRVAGVEPG